MHSLKTFWTQSSTGLKLALGVGLIVLIALVYSGTRSWVSHRKDQKADEAIAAERAIGEGHRQRADVWEERAKGLEVNLAKLEGDLKVAQLAIDVAGKKVEAAVEKIQDEDKRWVAEQEALGVAVDPCDRVRRACARYRIKAEECSCTSN